jgi:hypothetical protein
MADLIALLLAAVTGLLGPGVKQAELEQKVRAAIMEAQPVPIAEVAVKCKGVSAKQVDELTFELTDVMLDPLLISKATMVIGTVQPLKGGKVSIKSIKWTALIGEKELTKALNAHVESLSNASVQLDPEAITLKGKYKTILGKLPFEVKGQLTVDQQTLLMFHIDKSRMQGVSIPKQVNKIIEREVNPVYDLAKFAERSKKDIARAKEKLSYTFNLRVDTMTPQDGTLFVVGKA